MTAHAATDQTNDPEARSWLAAANEPDCAFPLQNLPFAVFKRGNESFRGGVAIGDQIVDLAQFSQLSIETAAAHAAHAASA